MARALYNEIDPYAAQWLRNLIAAGHIAPGDVDERSIDELVAADLREYTQVHFFAGIGVWPHALRLAGWPDDRPVWTGSCPCQPFSAAGKGAGFADERHLWPAFYHLISQCRPPVVFGEQVASKDGLMWLSLVQADLEAAGYRTGAADLCAAGVGAPHIRQRLYWVADNNDGREGLVRAGGASVVVRETDDAPFGLGWCGKAGWMGDSKGDGPEVRVNIYGQVRGQGLAEGRDAGRVDNPISIGRGTQRDGYHAGDDGQQLDANVGDDRPRPTHGHWRDADWLYCRDGKWRPVEPGTFPLAHGATARVGRLRAYGNAIVPQVAQAFIEAYLP